MTPLRIFLEIAHGLKRLGLDALQFFGNPDLDQ